MDSFSNNGGGDNTSQFVLSFELLTLLAWLIEHETDKLQKIVDKAVVSGLKQQLRLSEQFEQDAAMAQQARYNIVEFFGLLETLLSTALSKDTIKCATEKNLLPTIDHIDSTVCDMETLRGSIEKAATKLQNHPCDNPQQVLFEEILRSWKPNKKQMAH